MSEFNEDKLVRLVRLFVISIYGEELSMEDDGENYLKFYADGPTPLFHRNAWGRLWVDDGRLVKKIIGYLGVSKEEAYEIISLYFSKTYNIKIKDAVKEYDDENDNW